MRTAKTLIRLDWCPGWSESSLGAHSLFWFCHVAAHMSLFKSQLLIQYNSMTRSGLCVLAVHSDSGCTGILQEMEDDGPHTVRIRACHRHLHRLCHSLSTTDEITRREYLSLVTRKPVIALCEQQRRRSACASAQSDQHLCCSLPRYYNTSSFYIQNFKPLASFCSWAGRFESYLNANSKDRFSRDEAQF